MILSSKPAYSSRLGARACSNRNWDEDDLQEDSLEMNRYSLLLALVYGWPTHAILWEWLRRWKAMQIRVDFALSLHLARLAGDGERLFSALCSKTCRRRVEFIYEKDELVRAITSAVQSPQLVGHAERALDAEDASMVLTAINVLALQPLAKERNRARLVALFDAETTAYDRPPRVGFDVMARVSRPVANALHQALSNHA